LKRGFTVNADVLERIDLSSPDNLFRLSANVIYDNEVSDEYLEIYACPQEAFDRCANSRHISMCINTKNYPGSWKNCKEERIKTFIEKVALLCKNIPTSYYDECITITI